jgi:hypothetical protein
VAQSYDDIFPGDSLSDSRQKIINRDDTLRSLHSGTTEPSVMVPFMLWADTTTGQLKIRDSTNTVWYRVGDLDQAGIGLLLRDGTQPMLGALNMGGFKIQNLADGVAANDAATVGQLGGLTQYYYSGYSTAFASPPNNDRILFPAGYGVGGLAEGDGSITQDPITGAFTFGQPGVYQILLSANITGNNSVEIRAPAGVGGGSAVRSSAIFAHGPVAWNGTMIAQTHLNTAVDGLTWDVRFSPGGFGGMILGNTTQIFAFRVEAI